MSIGTDVQERINLGRSDKVPRRSLLKHIRVRREELPRKHQMPIKDRLSQNMALLVDAQLTAH